MLIYVFVLFVFPTIEYLWLDDSTIYYEPPSNHEQQILTRKNERLSNNNNAKTFMTTERLLHICVLINQLTIADTFENPDTFLLTVLNYIAFELLSVC